MNLDKVFTCFLWLGLLSRLLVNSVCPQYPCPGKRWVLSAGKSADKGLSSCPEHLMPLGCEHPFSCGAAMPRQHAKGVQGCLSAHWTQTWPSKRLPAAALAGSSDTHTHCIYIYAYVCKLQCLGQTSQLPSAVHSVKRLAVQEPEQSCVLQKSHSRPISVGFQRCSLCWPQKQRRFALTHNNQRFSCCLPLHFLHLTCCFSPAQLTYILHYASNGREYIKVQGIFCILPTFFITAIDIMY